MPLWAPAFWAVSRPARPAHAWSSTQRIPLRTFGAAPLAAAAVVHSCATDGRRLHCVATFCVASRYVALRLNPLRLVVPLRHVALCCSRLRRCATDGRPPLVPALAVRPLRTSHVAETPSANLTRRRAPRRSLRREGWSARPASPHVAAAVCPAPCRVLDSLVGHLGEPFQAESHKFRAALWGVKDDPPRWRNCEVKARRRPMPCKLGPCRRRIV